ncbi:hypothetical protein Tco_0036652 [Tanacetum coccineum]
MRKSMLLKLDANNAKDPITPKIAHSEKKEKPSKKLITRSGPFQGGGYRAAAPGFYQMNNANPSHEENSNLIKEIRASMDAAIRNQGASIKTLEIQIGKMNKVL